MMSRLKDISVAECFSWWNTFRTDDSSRRLDHFSLPFCRRDFIANLAMPQVSNCGQGEGWQLTYSWTILRLPSSVMIAFRKPVSGSGKPSLFMGQP